MKLLGSVFLMSLIAYGSITVWIFFQQDRLLFYPDISGRELVTTPRSIGIKYDSIRLTTQDNVSIHGWFIPHEHQRAVVLFCHGNAGNISHRMNTIEMLHDMGLSIFIFDYRGYGESEGKPTEQGTYNDADAAWNFLIKDKHYAASEIIIWGRSLGAAIAAHLAAKEDPVKGVILESTFTSVPDLGKEFYPLLPVQMISRFQYATKQHITAINSPVLLMHSRDDEIIPFAHGQQLFELANQPKYFVALSGGHNEYVYLNYDRYYNELKNFLTTLN